MVLSSIGLIQVLGGFGLGAATVQRNKLKSSQLSTLFWINAGLGLFLFSASILAAPLVVRFYSEPRLFDITLALSLFFFFSCLSDQHRALLRRQMRFSALASVDIISVLVGVALGIVMAWLGSLYWALIVSKIATAFLAFLLLWFLSGWTPSRPVKGSGVRPMLLYGGQEAAHGLLAQFCENLGKMLLGFFQGTSPVGLFSKSLDLHAGLFMQTLMPITKVAVSTLSRLQNQSQDYLLYYKRGLLYCLALSASLTVFLAVDARVFVLVFLGEQWLLAVPIFRILAFWSMARAFGPSTRWVFLSLAMTRRQLNWEIVRTLVVGTGCGIGIAWGIQGVAYAFSLSTALLLFPEMLYCFRGTPVRVSDVLESSWRPVLSSVISGFGLMVFNQWIWQGELPVLELLVDLAVFGLIYCLIWLVFPGGLPTIREAVRLSAELVRGLRVSKSNS